MITLNRNSLHYRIYTAFGLYRWRRGATPKNLCRYFWATAFGYLLPVLIIAIFVTLFVHDPLAFLGGMAILASVVAFIGLSFGLAFLVDFVIRKFHKLSPEPNIALEYLKAKKRKICPMIQWR